LLLRLAIGVVSLIQGGFYLSDNIHSTLAMELGGLLGLAAGAALLIGIFTPAAAVLVGLCALGTGFAWLPSPVPNLFDARLSAILAVIITAAIVFLGPGAFSLDARLFGRREIIIPPLHRSDH
jgi:uncharacterized membrane protein YphA (DoxX/SURF4 family)